MTSKQEIRSWLEKARREGAVYMLVVCDTFDYEDYPVAVYMLDKLTETAEHYHGRNMQMVMECYDLTLDLDQQLAEFRAWHGWNPS